MHEAVSKARCVGAVGFGGQSTKTLLVKINSVHRRALNQTSRAGYSTGGLWEVLKSMSFNYLYFLLEGLAELFLRRKHQAWLRMAISCRCCYHKYICICIYIHAE